MAIRVCAASTSGLNRLVMLAWGCKSGVSGNFYLLLVMDEKQGVHLYRKCLPISFASITTLDTLGALDGVSSQKHSYCKG